MRREDEIEQFIADQEAKYPDLVAGSPEYDHLRFLLEKATRLEIENARLSGQATNYLDALKALAGR